MMHIHLCESRSTVLIVLVMLTMTRSVLSGEAALGGNAAKQAGAAAAIASWTLATDDTKLTVGVGKDQQLYVYELCSPAAGWNWTSSPSPLPLVSRADVGGTRHALKWTYREGKVDTADGVKVTIRFTSRNPALELTSLWHARRGRGPVRHSLFLKNNSGGPITIYEQETLDVHLVGPQGDTQRMLLQR